ncbi:MAG: hypothetical protein AAF702_28140 [Chloroflexota bacterium]
MDNIDKILSYFHEKGVANPQPCSPSQLNGSVRLKAAIKVIAEKASKDIDAVGTEITLRVGGDDIAIHKRSSNVMFMRVNTTYRTAIFFIDHENELIPIEINERSVVMPLAKWSHELRESVTDSDLEECDLEAQQMLAQLADIWAENLEGIIQYLNDQAKDS